MTINQYLFTLEVLKNRREKYFEKYMRLHSRATSPGYSINTDGTPKTRAGSNSRETLILDAAEALAKYDKAAAQYDIFFNQLDANLAKLDYRERWALEIIYIENMGKPIERRRAGLCQALGVRKKSECGPIVDAAKEHLTEILAAQGIQIERVNYE